VSGRRAGPTIASGRFARASGLKKELRPFKSSAAICSPASAANGRLRVEGLWCATIPRIHAADFILPTTPTTRRPRAPIVREGGRPFHFAHRPCDRGRRLAQAKRRGRLDVSRRPEFRRSAILFNPAAGVPDRQVHLGLGGRRVLGRVGWVGNPWSNSDRPGLGYRVTEAVPRAATPTSC